MRRQRARPDPQHRSRGLPGAGQLAVLQDRQLRGNPGLQCLQHRSVAAHPALRRGRSEDLADHPGQVPSLLGITGTQLTGNRLDRGRGRLPQRPVKLVTED